MRRGTIDVHVFVIDAFSLPSRIICKYNPESHLYMSDFTLSLLSLSDAGREEVEATLPPFQTEPVLVHVAAVAMLSASLYFIVLMLRRLWLRTQACVCCKPAPPATNGAFAPGGSMFG